jgi:hypothetical protein
MVGVSRPRSAAAEKDVERLALKIQTRMEDMPDEEEKLRN